MFAEAFSCVKDAATELSRIWECPYNYFILKKTRSGILSNFQTDNSINVTSPDNGRVALILNKADYYTKVNAILLDGYKIQSPSNYRKCCQQNRQKIPLPTSYISSSLQFNLLLGIKII